MCLECSTHAISSGIPRTLTVTAAPTNNGWPAPEYDWEVLMQTIDPAAARCGVERKPRPRRWSLNGLAAVTERPPEVIADEMRLSGRVLGYYCPDVECCVFYLTYLRGRMIDSSDCRPADENDERSVPMDKQRVWSKVQRDILLFNTKGVRGFKRFSTNNHLQEAFDKRDLGDQKYAILCSDALKTFRQQKFV